ncbi:regulatory protein RecX [Kitasatospora sp. NPDC004240]
MSQHSEGWSAGPSGSNDADEPDDDYGPPDWFAAVAEPDPEPARPGPAPVARPGRSASPAPEEPDRWGAAGSGTPGAGAGVADLGLVSASELPAGRRRRRSALAEEADADGGAAAESAGRRASPGAGRRQRSEDGRRSRAGSPAPGYDPEGTDADPDADPAARGRTRAGRGPGGRGSKDGSAAGARGRTAAAEEQTDPETRARDICLRLLTGAAKTRKQLADVLRRREIPDEAAERVLDRLEEVGLIDDAAFAEAWVESRHAVRGLSRRALTQELRTRGVAGEAIERAVAQVDHEDEAEAARALVERKLRATRGLERQARTRRLVGVLARRGYSEGLAFRVVREALDAEAAYDPDEDVYGPDED